MLNPLLAPVHHLGYVVDDIERSSALFVERFGAGPFFRLDHVPLEGITSRGAPATYDHSSAFGAYGTVFLELMEFHEVGPESARAAFDLPRPSLHHVARLAPSIDTGITALEERSIPEVLRAHLGDIRFVYLDARPVAGHHVELLDDVPAFHEFFAGIRAAADEWDGQTDPLRPMGG